MKLTRIVYLHETFHLAKGLGVTLKAREDVAEKPLKISKNIVFLAPFLGIFSTISTTVTLPCTASMVEVLYKFDLIWGCNLPKTTQKLLKIQLFAGTNKFENI